MHRLFLDFAALIHALHGAEDAAALGESLKFEQDRFFDQVG